MTVREMVREAQAEVRTGDLLPERARYWLFRLSALLGNCLEEVREADAAYADVLLRLLDADEAANRARIRAQTTPEYARLREAKDTHALVIELVRAIKYALRSLDTESQLAR